MKSKRYTAFFLALVLIAQLALPVLALEDDAIHIQTAEDLLKLAENCRLDTWSQGKTVILDGDISLEGIYFTPIPTFGGTFVGNSHTISGIELIGGTIPCGIFGTLQQTAVVKDLTVKAFVAPTGDAKLAGGIAGENHGVLLNCHFEGTVTGKADIGGIVGSNGVTGAITECTVSGVIIGENMTGGIVGENLGIITACKNDAQVNTVSIDPSISLEDLNGDFLLDISKWTSLDTSAASMDTGGIAGYSSGSILSCINKGEVGYPHVGYNVGGIAGRSCGYISSSTNDALVHGRKDVGGIVGQMEPNIALNLSEDTIAQLKTELEALKVLVTDLKNSGISAAGNVSNRIDAILSYLDGATQSAENLGQAADSYADSVTSEFNRVSIILSDVLRQLEGIAGQAATLSETVTTGLSQLETAMQDFAVAAQLTEDALGHLNAAMDDLREANADAQLALEQIQTGITSLENAIPLEDEEAIRSALAQIQQGFANLAAAAQKAAEAAETIQGLVENSETMPEEVIVAAGELSDALQEGAAALKTISDGIAMLPVDPEVDTQALSDGMQSIRSGFASLSSAIAHFQDAAEDIELALEKAEDASGQMAVAMDSLSEAMGTFSSASAQLGSICESVEILLNSVNSQPAMQIPEKNPEIESSAEDIFANVNSMSDELKSLNQQIDSYGQEAVQKIDAITAKFETVVELALEIVGQTLDPETDNIVSDTSDADVDAVTTGKVYGCVNTGSVEGDLNIGGITGSMSIEYELDPEDDLTSSVNGVQQRVYEMKAIVQSCVNSGAVTAKRSYTGGIVGQMNLGLAVSCENYGPVTSESGDYVGGIAGVTSAKIQTSFAKCSLSGRKYVGGIAGSGVAETLGGAVSSISGCYSMVAILGGSQYLGAVSGGNSGNFSGNFFVSDPLAGINGISYAGKAEPIHYDALLALPDLPENFRKLTVQFVSDGEVLKTVLADYGESFDETVFPEIPAKEGCWAVWDLTELTNIRFDTVVNVVYTPYVTGLPGEDARTGGRPIFIAEGQFDDQATLKAESQPNTPAAFDKIPITWQEGLIESFVEGKIYRAVVEQWKLTIPADGTDSHTIRYLSPEENADHLAVFVKQNGVWKEMKSDAIGSYLTFTVDGTEVEIAILSTVNVWWVWLIPLILALALVLLIVAIVKRIRRKPKPTPQPDAEEDAEEIEAEIERLRAELESMQAQMREREGVTDGK